MNKLITILVCMLVIIGAGCAVSAAPTPDQTDQADPDRADPDRDWTENECNLLSSPKSRAEAPSVTFEDISAAASSVNQFALALYDQVKNLEGNLLFSPYSIQTALAMTYAGARGETKAEMERALYLSLGEDKTHTVLNALDQRLIGSSITSAARGGTVSGDQDDSSSGFLFKTANSLWGQKGMPFSEAFLDVLAENYGTGMRLLDFMRNPEASRQIINEWAAAETEDKIQNLLPPEAVTPNTRLVLTNAVYFKAAWASPFAEELTRPGVFHLLEKGRTVQVEMMNRETRLGYSAGENFTAVEIPYQGHLFSMVLLVPGNFILFENSITNKRLETLLEEIRYETVNLSMPAFSFTRELGLNDILSGMGMPTAFTGSADFTGMSETGNLAISDVRHKAFIDVNEEGTEAAAATAVGVSLTSMPMDPITVTVDRPFLSYTRYGYRNNSLCRQSG